MSSFWSVFIIALTAANIAFALVILYGTARRRKHSAPEPETTGHVWDGDLRELNKPLPRWWLYSFYLSVAFAIVYLVLYPGLGAFRGTLSWTQVRQYTTQVAQADATTAPVFASFAGKSIEALRDDPTAMRIAQNLFAANCAMCHGSDARGATGFPNLAATNFQWGRDPALIEQTIAQGRVGVMPAWQAVVGDDGVEQLANYVLSLSGKAPRPELVAVGGAKFAQLCVACHGPDAHGNPAMGAPNLADDNWLYGESIESVRKTIAAGRQNHMPAHLERLGATKVRALAAYVLSLAPREAPPPVASPHATGS